MTWGAVRKGAHSTTRKRAEGRVAVWEAGWVSGARAGLASRTEPLEHAVPGCRRRGGMRPPLVLNRWWDFFVSLWCERIQAILHGDAGDLFAGGMPVALQ